jgi:hypothetical protein
MKTQRFPSITLGVDLLSNETSLPKGAVREAINVDIDRAGNFNRRAGYTKVVAGTQFHSIKTASLSGLVLVAQAHLLKQFDPSTYALNTVFTMNSDDPVDYTEHDGNLYATNKTTLFWLPQGDSAFRLLGVPTPQSPSLAATATGGLDSGDYTVAVTVLDSRGEESGSSDYVAIRLASPGGVAVSNLPTYGARVRIYITPPNGEGMYLAKEFASGPSSTSVGDDIRLKKLETSALEPLPPGNFVRGFNGRLYTAVDNVLNFSESFRYGLYFPAHNKIRFQDSISFIEPVMDGMFVGAGNRTYFLAGGDPTQWKQVPVNGSRPIYGSSVLVPSEHFPDKMIQSPAPVAVWLSNTGYFAGLPGGSVVPLQPDRLRIGATSGRSAILFREGRKQIVTPVNSSTTVTYGSAVDTSV